jgi:hypothetical protein
VTHKSAFWCAVLAQQVAAAYCCASCCTDHISVSAWQHGRLRVADFVYWALCVCALHASAWLFMLTRATYDSHHCYGVPLEDNDRQGHVGMDPDPGLV